MDNSIWNDIRLRYHWNGLSDTERLALPDPDAELIAVPDRLPDFLGGADIFANSKLILQRNPKHEQNRNINTKQ